MIHNMIDRMTQFCGEGRQVLFLKCLVFDCARNVLILFYDFVGPSGNIVRDCVTHIVSIYELYIVSCSLPLQEM